MRRFATVFNLFLALVFVAPSFGQSVRSNPIGSRVQASSGHFKVPTFRKEAPISPIFLGEKGALAPLAQLEILSNNFDTTENWYSYPARGMRIDTFQNQAGETIIDTLYVMGMAETFTTSLNRPYIDSVHMPLGVLEGEAVPANNVITARIMRVADQASKAGNVLPWPDWSVNPPASATISGGDLQVGVWQDVVFKFGHKSLGVRADQKRFAVYVDRGGTDPWEDSLTFMVEADLSDYLTGSEFSIDTDLYRTYIEFRDWYQGYVTQQFWTNIQTTDPTQAFFGNLIMTVYLSDPTGAVADGDNAPTRLDQNYPNPATADGKTNIRFNLQGDREVSLKLYNELGNEISSLVSGPMSAGPHNVNVNVNRLPNGTYFYKLQSGDFVATRSMIVHH